MRRSFFTLLFAPLFFIACSPNNVTVDNSLQRYFDSAGVQGSFGFFDNGQGHFTIYNLSRFRDSFYQPGATFDILQSLIAIQTGVVKDDSSVIFPGGDRIQTDSIHSLDIAFNLPPLSLRQAFQAAADTGEFGFLELASRIGRDSLKKWIDSLQYGNKELGKEATPFWADNSLKINSDEQLGLLKKLYFDQLPFYPRPQLIVRRMMSGESNSNYQLRYKIARGTNENGHAIGWVMGWVEENKHPYFFVVNLESADPQKDLGAAGLSIARGILQQMGFFQGKK